MKNPITNTQTNTPAQGATMPNSITNPKAFIISGKITYQSESEDWMANYEGNGKFIYIETDDVEEAIEDLMNQLMYSLGEQFEADADIKACAMEQAIDLGYCSILEEWIDNDDFEDFEEFFQEFVQENYLNDYQLSSYLDLDIEDNDECDSEDDSE